jgi:DNA repair exonuclease SbcCD ATPase subunit
MDKVLRRITDKKRVVTNMYNKLSLPILIKRKQQEIRSLEEMIEKNVKAYEFLDEDEKQVKQMTMEITIADNIILELENEMRCLLQTPTTERDPINFSCKSNQLHDMIEQQDILRSKRQAIVTDYEDNLANFNSKRHDLCKQLEQLQNELSVLQQK